MKNLKPNGISHTVYPDKPAQGFNDWIDNRRSQIIARDVDEYKRKFDALWADFKKSITS
jgi:hypothetical protein